MKVRTALVGFALCLCLCAFVAGPTVAQDTGSGNESSTSEIYDELGDLTVETVEYGSGTFEITMRWNGELTQQVSLTELIELDGSGSTGINIQQQRLRPDESTTVTIGAEKHGGTAAVILSSEQSLSNGNALVIQSGSPSSREPVPFDLAALSVVASALIGVVISIVLVVRKKNAEERGKERIA